MTSSRSLTLAEIEHEIARVGDRINVLLKRLIALDERVPELVTQEDWELHRREHTRLHRDLDRVQYLHRELLDEYLERTAEVGD